MPAHRINLELPGVDIINRDAIFEIHQNGEMLGKLKVSRGTIEWVPRDHTLGHHLDWDQFDRLMKKHGEVHHRHHHD
jgi:hypothetical protein